MTTDDASTPPNMEKLEANLKKIEELSQRLVKALSQKQPIDPSLQGPGQDLYIRAAAAYMADVMANPAKLMEHQIAYWGETLKHYIDAQKQLATGEPDPEEQEKHRDPRFSSPLWEANPYFNFIKNQYLLNAEAIEKAVNDIEGLDAHDKRRVAYFTRQIVDMFSPTNFLATNPEALARAVETDGDSLVRGLENLVRDLERNKGDLLVTLADEKSFAVGKNLATTKGSVVFRNRLLELIQYAPATEKVHKTPLIIFPPWINKFYVLDLKPQNSLVKWVVDQGFTVFIVSWVNPDASYADVGMDDYVQEGYLAAIEEVKKITGEEQVNAVGYCIGGTTLALTLALMNKRKDKSIKAATLFTTLTDFKDQGEFEAFLDDDFVDGIERECNEKGYLSSFFMARTFSYLRANDLIYKPAIRSYMMGEAPPAFDLLYWNGDGTNLPGRMAVEYLRWLCQEDRFARGKFEMLGETLAIRDVKQPLCAIACETDHIAGWKSSYAGVQQMGSKDKTFILAQSGHIAGIVNPPGKKKYGHYTNPDLGLLADDWLESATFHQGTWWPTWAKWLAGKSGPLVQARQPGDSDHPELAPAPGTYVLVKSNV